jgi:hypothetical protein
MKTLKITLMALGFGLAVASCSSDKQTSGSSTTDSTNMTSTGAGQPAGADTMPPASPVKDTMHPASPAK